jgi:outer membrane protein TolC
MKILALFAALTLQAQSLKEAVNKASERYPSIKISREQVNEASAAVNLARTAFLPRVDATAQVNRATANNVFGLLFPNTVIPPISGPQIDGDQSRNVFGAAIGMLVTWEPFDFGRRQADVDAAAAGKARAESSIARAKLDAGAAAADAYLSVVAAQQTVAAAQASLERYRQFETIIDALAKAELRPGADLARMQAERIVAETNIIRAEQAVAQAKALLEQYTGEPVATIDSAPFVRSAEPIKAASAAHPYLREQQFSIDEVIARMKAIDKSWYPRFAAQAAAFGRGSGARVNGPFAGGGRGLYPDHGNWAVGFSATFPLLDYKALRARKEIELQKQRKEEARRELIERELAGRAAQARAQLDGAKRIAEIAPKQIAALQTALDQTQARYKAGLGTLIEVADAQRQLTQAEIETSIARIAVWRAELSLAYAQGDLDPFLARLP